MQIIKTKNYKELSEKAFKIISKEIKKKPNSKIGFATGKTPIELYKKLAKSKINFSKIKAFNLDEYYPIKKTNKKSFYYYMQKRIIKPLKISKYFLLNGEDNPKEQIKNYKKFIKKPDIIILGIGKNSHIAFNEPNSKPNSKTRLINLIHKKTKAITIGISEIITAKKIILITSGKNKTKAIKHLIQDKPNSKYPATFLKKHKNFIVIVDETALNFKKGKVEEIAEKLVLVKRNKILF